MALTQVGLPIQYYPDPLNNRAIFSGELFIGDVGTDPEIPANQKQVFISDSGITTNPIPTSQPITIGSGGVPLFNNNPVTVFVNGSYSLKVKDNNGNQVYYFSDATNGIPITSENGLLTVADVISLRTLEPVIDGQQISLQQHTADSGEGGGIFYYDASDITSIDNNGTIIVTSGGARWIRAVQDPMSVHYFGAVGDNSTNNDTAFTNALATGKLLYIPDGEYIYTPLLVNVNYRGPGVVKTTPSVINFLFNRIGNIAGNVDKNHFSLGCIPRNNGGTWELLDDATHTPMNVTSVTLPDITTVRVNYRLNSSKINSFIAAPDDALAPHGVLLGGDVGTSFANIKGFAPFGGAISRVGAVGSISINDIWVPEIGNNITLNTLGGTDSVLVGHPASVTNDVPVVSLEGGLAINADLVPIISTYNSGSFQITMHSNAKGFVSFNGVSWTQGISPNTNAPILTWQAGSSAIRVDHGIANSTAAIPSVTQFGPYIPRVSNIGTTFFEVQFYDYTGTQILVEDVSMQFLYSRDLLVPTNWPDSLNVLVKRGPCILTTVCYGGVPGNNIWVSGNMES